MSTPPQVYTERRSRLLAAISGGVAVFHAAPLRTRSNDVEFPFRQDSDFGYLTGFDEPEAVAVLAPAHPEHRFVLFVRPRDPEREVWTGRRAGVEGAKERYGADEAFPIAELEAKLPDYLKDVQTLYYTLGRYPDHDLRVIGLLNRLRAQARAGVGAPTRIVDPGEVLHEMRLVKSPQELEVLRRAVAITVEAHQAAMRALRPGMREYEIEALIEYVFRRSGSRSPGYPSIVGAGANATVLHYTANSGLIAEGDLLLIDAGAEVDWYTADVTRTLPCGGRYTGAQRDVYQLVLAAQRASIETVRPGAAFQDYHDRSVRVLTEGMISLGLLKGGADENIEQKHFRRYFMHRTGHWLGMDVHDVGRYREGSEWRPLEPGMVLTVEPGLYIAADDAQAPEAFRGIGVRIEDDVLVTPEGREVLTRACPKETGEVERVMAEAFEPIRP